MESQWRLCLVVVACLGAVGVRAEWKCELISNEMCSNHASGKQLTGAPQNTQVESEQDCINKCKDDRCTSGYFHDSYTGSDGTTHPMICKLYGGSATANECIPSGAGQETKRLCCGSSTTSCTSLESSSWECEVYDQERCSNHASGMSYVGAPENTEVASQADCIRLCKNAGCTGGYFHDSYDSEGNSYPMVCKIYGGTATSNDCAAAEDGGVQKRLCCGADLASCSPITATTEAPAGSPSSGSDAADSPSPGTSDAWGASATGLWRVATCLTFALGLHPGP